MGEAWHGLHLELDCFCYTETGTLIKKCDFGECIANDPRMHDECEQSLKVSANVWRVLAVKLPFASNHQVFVEKSFLLDQSPSIR